MGRVRSLARWRAAARSASTSVCYAGAETAAGAGHDRPHVGIVVGPVELVEVAHLELGSPRSGARDG